MNINFRHLRIYFVIMFLFSCDSNVDQAETSDDPAETNDDPVEYEGPLVTNISLPYDNLNYAFLGQGPNGRWTHANLYAWDFVLNKGEKVLAIREGIVVWLIDDSNATGTNDFNSSNHIFIDHGDHSIATYTHHSAGSAKVILGQKVAAGSYLADVGASGTSTPHIHFDVRGSYFEKSWPLKFKVKGSDYRDLSESGCSGTSCESYQSENILDENFDAGSIKYSTFMGSEFALNGVQLSPRDQAYRLPSGEEIMFSGTCSEDTVKVHFAIWKSGQPSEFFISAIPDSSRKFSFKFSIPETSKGSRWYRIFTENSNGEYLDKSTLPVWID